MGFLPFYVEWALLYKPIAASVSPCPKLIYATRTVTGGKEGEAI